MAGGTARAVKAQASHVSVSHAQADALRGGLAGRALELRELRYFHSVAHAGNFGRAARELKISQPAVSSQVLKLEEGLGTQLLIRHGRGVTLTPAGTCLLDRIDVIMRLLSAPLDPAPVPELAAGTVTVALPPELAPLLGPRLLEACRGRAPSVTLTVREGTSASLEEWMLDRQADIAVLQDPPAIDGIDVEPIVTEALGFVSGVRTPVLDGHDKITLRQISGLTLMLPGRRHWVRRLVESAAFRGGIVLDRVHQVDSVPLATEMVRDGLGCTVLPYAAVRDEAERGRLLFRPIGHEPPRTVHAIANRSEKSPTPFASEVRLMLRGLMRGLAQSDAWPGAAAISAKPAKGAIHPLREAAIA